MIDAVAYAIPAFVLLVIVEALSFRLKPHHEQRGYELKDAATSMTMGAGSQVVGFFWKFAVVVVYAGVYTLTPFELDPTNLWTWVLLFFADDLAYYWFHRCHHRIRLLWASHVVHHSSQYFNLTTALRQSWTPMGGMPFWLPLVLMGMPPWMIFLQQSINLTYQFFIHTERVRYLPGPLEFWFNTPSHHRVHHGSDEIYLDRNYGGILIIWDRIFGSFAAETAPVTYGLTQNIRTYNPLRVAFHEYAAIWRDVRASRTWRDRLGYLFGPPGWGKDLTGPDAQVTPEKNAKEPT
ncbi:sterol desaturase family protein [Natronoglycomyces albus]|uniref:Sterol desaturase family protein n=1 Tax=Natronoglycomyces albus TaxID=2811108 RepID=A0A895XJ28_9ACTN|nr:sterol desaturase family protein [Natronoglycomyces albus]QSB05344.1 sterol desaturase family protein [Natronoglycomyces albus]